MDKHRTFIDRLQDIVARQSDKTAFTFLQGGETESDHLSYQQLETQARAIAAVLQSYNATGEKALLLYQPGLEFITAFVGCLYAGVVAVPAYPPRANRSIDRVLSIVADADAKFALTTQDLQDKIEIKFHQAGNTGLQFIPTNPIEGDLADNWLKPDLTPDDLAFLQYTSGSTGKPKGVMVSHGNLLANSSAINRGFQNIPQHKVVSWLPPYHDMGLIGCIIQPMYVGLSMYMMPPVSFLQRPYRWLQAISKYRATTSGAPNFAYDLCVSQISEAQRETLDLSCWELAFSGAEPVRADTIKQFSEYFGTCGFRRKVFYPCYGMAESTLIITGGSKQEAPIFRNFQKQSLEENQAVISSTDTALDNQVTLVGCGQNFADQHLAIVNTDTLEECPEGQIGEIWASSSSTAQGYWNKAALTEYAFQGSLTGYPDVTFLRTGDLGFIQDGELFVTGRLKDLIIIRGRNHYPQDIELTVDSGHEAVRSGAVAAFAVEIEGEEKLVIVAEVKRTHLRKLDVAAVSKAIRKTIFQNHELNPYAIVLIKTGSIPKTSSGKIQRHACKAGFLDGSLNVVGESVKQSSGNSPKGLAPNVASEQGAVLTARHINSKQGTVIENWLVENIAQRLAVSKTQIDIREPFA
ncbi:MAG: fatty acyl-AMP ligase, partial [Xenococcaceae cyanobacterium MO_167.B52]|nr:fatty acyl-AMP ligase [Xenococcaceae cyanobacterium MO_167.B52]